MATDLDQLRQQYQETVATLGKNWKMRGPAFVELVRPLMNPEAIAMVATMERDHLRSTLALNSIGTKLSAAGYIKGFKSIPLVDGQNAAQYKKADGSVAIRHIAHDVLSLSPDEWSDRNDTTRVIDRIEDEDKIALVPQDYLQKAIALLDSPDWVDVAAGLVALTGRRPHEIVARGSFTRITGSKDWAVKFTGQGKKRGENPVFNIPTLCDPNTAKKALKAVRDDEEVKTILSECFAVSDDATVQNAAIDSRTNKRINRVVKREFGSILPQRKGDKVDEETEATGNCKALRAAYAALVTKRDKGDRSISEQLLYAGRALGHVATEKTSDKDLMHLLTTLGYADFVIDGDVPFLNVSIAKKSSEKLSATESVHEWVNQKTDEWGCTQSEVISRLIKVFELAQSTPATPKQDQQNQDEGEDMELIEVKQQVATLIEQVAFLTDLVTGNRPNPEPQPIAQAPKPIAQRTQPKTPSPEQNWGLATAEDLWGADWNKPARASGAAEERIDRAIRAVFEFNNQMLSYPAKEKWAVTNRLVRDLTGANGQMIAARFKVWEGLITEHHSKHEIAGDYHNRAHHRGADAELVQSIFRPMIASLDP